MSYTVNSPNNNQSNISVNVNDVYHLLDKVFRTDIVPFLWGPPGVGKSTIVQDIAEANGWEYINLRISNLSPVDFRGLPVINHDTRQVDWYPPAFLPDSKSKTVGLLFLDELNLAPQSVQAAAYQLILDKRVGEYKLPKSWKIVAAGNREEDRANVNRVSAPLLNRFIHFDIQPDFDVFKDWGSAGNMREDVMFFLKTNNAKLMLMPSGTKEKAFPTPRSWKFLSDLLDAFDYEGGPMDKHLKRLVIGTVGPSVSDELIKSLEENVSEKVNKKIEKYIKTGNISLGKNEDERFLVFMNVFVAYKKGKLTEEQYEKMLEKMNPEEVRVMDKWKEENKQKIAARYNGPIINQSGRATRLVRVAHPATTTFHVKEHKILKPGLELLVYDENGNREIIKAKTIEDGKLLEVKRGLENTSARRWEQDSKIQVFGGEWEG